MLLRAIHLSAERIEKGERNIYVATGPYLLTDAFLEVQCGIKTYASNTHMSREAKLGALSKSGVRPDMHGFSLRYEGFSYGDIYQGRDHYETCQTGPTFGLCHDE